MAMTIKTTPELWGEDARSFIANSAYSMDQTEEIIARISEIVIKHINGNSN